MVTRTNAVIAAAVVLLYVGTIEVGLHVKSLGLFGAPADTGKMEWQPPSRSSIPEGAAGDSIRRGLHIFEDTADYAPQYTDAKVSCASCHAGSGMQAYAMPLVDVPAHFPMYSKRAGHVISLADRIEECFVRSENGVPLPYDSPEMKALIDYFRWLSEPQPENLPFKGRGLAMLAEMRPDAKHGAQVYAAQCAGCHGDHGQGIEPLFPPLWGPFSFNDGAGMNNVRKMASFVQRNMPENRKGILTPQDAFDVAAFVHEQKRPRFNAAFSRY
ncbi:MAG: c-type cytochrome [Acidobacteriota bacterium]